MEDDDHGPEDDGEDADKCIDIEAMSSLRDTKYNLQVTLHEPARGLQLRPLTLIFDDTTIYGHRAACHDAWLVTSSASSVAVRTKPIFKRLVVDKIPMLPCSAACCCF